MEQRTEIALPTQLVNRIHSHVQANPEWTPADVVTLALRAFEDGNEEEIDMSDLLDRFARFRGMAKGWTLKEMLQDRRDGLL